MQIRLLHLLEGARNASGLTVIIDVFRAFSLECYMMHQGASSIIPVGRQETAYELKQTHPHMLLAGERGGVMLEGFDFGNSPAQIAGLDLTGRTVIHTTSAGTQGLTGAVQAEEILTGSLVNASAIASYIKSRNPSQVSLVCMGLSAVSRTEEDTLCGEYIRSLLLDRPLPSDELRERIQSLRNTSGARFFLPDCQDSCPEEDFALCTAVNRFPFVLRAEKGEDGLLRIRRIDQW